MLHPVNCGEAGEAGEAAVAKEAVWSIVQRMTEERGSFLRVVGKPVQDQAGLIAVCGCGVEKMRGYEGARSRFKE